jgi:transposase
VVGIDDWSWQRGSSYGTIIVDLERREVVDVLPDRSAETVAQRLERHPGIRIVSRDRCGIYAQGARQGAPQAKQVADRFHLLQNLRLTIEKELSRSYRQPARPVQTETTVVNAGPSAYAHGRQPELCVHRAAVGGGRRAVWLEQFDRVKTLQREGKNLTAIAREAGVNFRTVAKWTMLDELPERSRMAPRTSAPRRFESYLKQRWADGFRTARHLLPEIQKLGYTGSLTHLERQLGEWRRTGVASIPASLCGDPERGWSAQRLQTPPIAASYLCIKPRGQLKIRELEKVALLKEAAPGFETMRKLAMRFRGILSGRDPEKLDVWLDDAHRCGLYGLRRFAYTVRRDLAAVQNAITERWSNGQTEGQINRLKTLKRAMYGRAGAELLRARLLPIHTLPTK